MTRTPSAAAIAVAIALSVTLSACGETKSQAAPASPPPPPVSVAAALERKVVDWEEFPGRIEAVEQVDVGEADAGGLDLDEDLARARHGDRDLFHGELLAVQVEASGEHGVHEDLLSESGIPAGRPMGAVW